ncbi:ABC transporter permease [Pseudonocardia sp. H11422]|uniref:ABC transporter permease n=1 Tax=Pseudonocardia sp. H11422 TaxID=2835866 RepID=UPI001BDD0A16|nr:ABC transporter permease [Pseudonocardia sp. H11422]
MTSTTTSGTSETSGTTSSGTPATRPTARRGPAGLLGEIVTRPSAGVLALLALICVVMAFLAPSFLTYGNWYNLAQQMVYVALLAIGMTIVLITGGIDLSVGSVLGLSAGVMAYLINQGLIFGLALVLAVATGAGLGLINGLVITKLGIPDFVATLAMLGVASGLLFLWTGGVPFIGFMLPDYEILGGGTALLGDLTAPILAMVVIAVLVALIMRRTSFGRHAYGVGSNREAARLSGVAVVRVRITAYVISGTLAACAGVLLAGRTTTVAPTMGVGYEIQAIAAAVIGGAALAGGRGRILGAVLGALTLTVASNVINLASVSPTWQSVAIGAILLVAVGLDRASAHLSRRLGRAVPSP